MARISDYQHGHIHLIGIGGSSMSGLAQMLIDQGYTVSESDRDDGYLLKYVREAGAYVSVGHRAENVHHADLVVYSAAISSTNPEMEEAKRLGIPTMERAELLGQLMQGFQKATGICGAHGKTTVSSMISQILLENGCDPSISIGGRLDAIGGSTRVGHSDIFVAEACEFNRSFLQMHPFLEVVLNIDADHLDCYGNLEEIEKAFRTFMSFVPPEGLVIGNGDDFRVMRCMQALRCRKATFGTESGNDWYPASAEESDNGCWSFSVMHHGKKAADVQLTVPGAFNITNALAAIAACDELGVPPHLSAPSVSRFTGAHRRFELTDIIDGVEIYTDYGHNPVEMHNALSVAVKRCKGRVWAVMQPHTFSRVRTLFDQYLTCTQEADFTLVTDICAAREPDPGDLNSGMLVEGMRKNGINALWTPSFDDTEKWLRTHWQPGDLVLTMGCGDINLLNDQIHRHEQERMKANR